MKEIPNVNFYSSTIPQTLSVIAGNTLPEETALFPIKKQKKRDDGQLKDADTSSKFAHNFSEYLWHFLSVIDGLLSVG